MKHVMNNDIDIVAAPVFNMAEYRADYALFHTAGASAQFVPAASLEYMVALSVTQGEHTVPYNISLTAIEHMAPAAAEFVAAYQVFHSAAAAPIVEAGTMPYIIALTTSIQEHIPLYNVSLTAVDNMSVDARAWLLLW